MTTPRCGTWQRYASKHTPCRCLNCRAAWRDYSNARNRGIAYGRITPAHMVDATPARERLAELREFGVGARALAETHDISRATLERIANGTQSRVRNTTLATILAIRPNPATLLDRAKVDGTGARRRIQALVAAGWTMSALADRMGCTGENVRQIATGRNGHYVTAGTWRAVAEVYRTTWDKAPRSGSEQQRAASTAARRMAVTRGWPPPLAWDDDSIDDPNATPADARTEVKHRFAGRPNADVVEDVTWLLEHDSALTTVQAADRLGIRVDSLQQAMRRAGEHDMAQRLALNAELTSTSTGRRSA